ncbi:unnamed protein product [Fraxinus pennsylvanica]|uniref:Uncharacterized protein n=1 Tax=Fraxinus pennsylvanica TaxID=56036 RepID=A0AAD2AFT1_9LAMI|nr:unnamed protein product [Fraxinus pennsylvanica]
MLSALKVQSSIKNLFAIIEHQRLFLMDFFFGNVGFLNVDIENDDGYENYIYHPHSGPASGLVINPFSMSKIFSSCYGGLIRLMDVEEMFDLIFSSCYGGLIRLMDVEKEMFDLGHGGVNVWDLKAGKPLSSWNLHDDRINTINFNPENSNMMATSSSDGTACIWDLRHMDADKRKYLSKTLCHERAVHSAYFSPSGRFLATTILDDQVGLLSGANYEETSMVNQKSRRNSAYGFSKFEF